MSDAAIRQAAFGWLTEQVERHDDVLPRSVLHAGFRFRGARVPLVGPQGIFKPRVCELPLSVLTACNGPYDDRAAADGRFLYAYRGRDPRHRDNEGLRMLMRRRIPLIYFYCLLPGRYLAAWPIFVVGDEPERLQFTIQLDDARVLDMLSFRDSSPTIALHYEPGGDERRRYVTREFEVRLHQRRFRERVLRAYRTQCALCRLRHHELLDAAHIVPDGEPGGDPRVPNGLALCKLHHAAFDRLFVGVRPDGVIEVRRDILEEQDGPMLVHGLKRLHRHRIHAPGRAEDRPDPNLLERRYERFRAAAK